MAANELRCPGCGAVVHYRTASEAMANVFGVFLGVLLISLTVLAIIHTWRAIL